MPPGFNDQYTVAEQCDRYIRQETLWRAAKDKHPDADLPADALDSAKWMPSTVNGTYGTVSQKACTDNGYPPDCILEPSVMTNAYEAHNCKYGLVLPLCKSYWVKS